MTEARTGPLGSVILERDRAGTQSWAVTVTRAGRAPHRQPFSDRAHALTFAAGMAALHDLALLNVGGEDEQ